MTDSLAAICNPKKVKKKRKRTISRKFQTGPVFLAIATIILICLISFLFLFQVFQSSTEGYKISDLEKKVEELKEKNKQLEIEAAKLRSLEHIESLKDQLNMVETRNIVYVKEAARTVVVNR